MTYETNIFLIKATALISMALVGSYVIYVILNKDELGGFATFEEAVRACERGEGEHVTMNQSNIHTCRFKIKNFIKKIPLFKLQTCTPTQGRVDDKLALGGIAVLAGTLICLIPHPVAQVVGGALIVSGLGTGGTALLDQSEINEVLQGAQ